MHMTDIRVGANGFHGTIQSVIGCQFVGGLDGKIGAVTGGYF